MGHDQILGYLRNGITNWITKGKKERLGRIKELWLSELMKESVVSDEDLDTNVVESAEEKEAIIDKVLEDMVESGDLDD